ncbi:hypothetical protein KC866_01960 [Patescibacteria group bacterium]|nr:hypothetical protein [Patescibacteria group bacterium]
MKKLLIITMTLGVVFSMTTFSAHALESEVQSELGVDLADESTVQDTVEETETELRDNHNHWGHRHHERKEIRGKRRGQTRQLPYYPLAVAYAVELILEP